MNEEDMMPETGANGNAPRPPINSQPQLIAEARELLRAGKIDAAHTILVERATKGAPDISPQAWYTLAITEAEAGRYQNSIEILHYLFRLMPNELSIRQSLNQVLLAKSEDFIRSMSSVLYARANYTNYPRTVILETSSRCNAKCTFCPHQTLERRNNVMEESLFKKIIEDLKAIPTHHKFVIAPYFVSEPFMDRNLFDRLRYVNDQLPNAYIFINTNLNFLPTNFFENMLTLRNFAGMRVSLNNTNKEEYEKVMGINFERTVENIKSVMDFNRRVGLYKGPLLIFRVGEVMEREGQFAADLKRLFGEFEEGQDYAAIVGEPTDWLGDVDMSITRVPHHRACGLWFKIVIMSNGIVPFCCMDADGKFAWGDVSKNSVLDVYNTPAFRSIRETALTRETIYPCNKCNAITRL